MKIASFDITLGELAGSMGDFGTLFPLAIGYIAVCGLDPAGILIMMGLANIVTGLVYQLPMPIEPMKVLAVMAIAQRWSPSMVYASGFAMGIIWLILGLTGIMVWVAKVTPKPVIQGIQVALGILLAIQAVKMMSTWWALGGISILIVLLFHQNRYAPAAIVLILLGVAIMLIKGKFRLIIASPAITLPSLTGFRLEEIWQTLLLAGFAQIPLTATNAVIATSSLIKSYWPDKPVTEKHLSLNMGIINLVLPFWGGMPLCHGAGGLAGQYYFGARTGGTNLIEGTIEILMGLFLASSIAGLFAVFPTAIIGAMMFLVGIELTRFAKDIHLNYDLAVMIVTIVASILTNMAYGFMVGLLIHYLPNFTGSCKNKSIFRNIKSNL